MSSKFIHKERIYIMKKILSAFLALLMLAFPLAACSEDAGNGTVPGEENTGAVSTTEAETTYSRENYPDDLPATLNFNGAAFRMCMRGSWATLEFGSGEDSADVIDAALYKRNTTVSERLGVTPQVILGPTNSSEYSKSYYATVIAGTDEYDIIQVVHNAGIQYSHQKIFVNLIDMPHINYEKPWYNVNYMNAISVHPDSRYLLQGDFCLHALRNISAMVYNKALYEDLYKDGDALYTTVLDGKWTHDLMKKMCAEAYKDVNANGSMDLEDVLGGYSNTVTHSDHYTYTLGFSLEERDAIGYPKLTEDQSRNVRVLESLDNLFFATSGYLRDTVETSATAPAINRFKSGGILLYADRLYLVEGLGDMEIAYGVIPYPKLDEEQKDYVSIVHNSSTLTAVPITLPEKQYEFVGACIEAMFAESYRVLTPAYYDIALKLRYSQDSQSGQTIDLIRDSMTTDFFYANSDTLSKVGTISRNLLMTPGSSYMSAYDSIKEAVNTKLQTLIENATKKD